MIIRPSYSGEYNNRTIEIFNAQKQGARFVVDDRDDYIGRFIFYE